MRVTPPPTTEVTPGNRRRGHRRKRKIAALAAAVVGAGALVLLPEAGPPELLREPAVVTIDRAWPESPPTLLPAQLPDGPAYNPVYLFDTHTSLGTAPSPAGAELRLIMHSADGTQRELRRLPIDEISEYSGFTRSGNEFAWAETTLDEEGREQTEIWAATLGSDRPAHRLTADTGDVILVNSQYDLVIHDDRLHWTAVAAGDRSATELRSVALTGGAVTKRTVTGAWAHSAWPWLVSAGSGYAGPVRLRDPEARKIIAVDTAATELATCSPSWCRVLVLSGETTRIDLMRPDGSERQSVAGDGATASVIDVAALDRFEVFAMPTPHSATTSSQQLALYDLRHRQIILVADGVGRAMCRDGLLWWSTGDYDNITWHAVDLRTLP